MTNPTASPAVTAREQGIGVDITEVAGWRRRLDRTPSLNQVAFAPEEAAWADGQPGRAARLWAIKEAVVKALGCGFDGIGWDEVVIDLRSQPVRVQLRSAEPALRAAADARWSLLVLEMPPLVVAVAAFAPAAPGGVHETATDQVVLHLRPVPPPATAQSRPQGRSDRQPLNRQPLNRQHSDRQNSDRHARQRRSCDVALSDAARALLGQPGAVRVSHQMGHSPLVEMAVPFASASHCPGWVAAAVGALTPATSRVARIRTPGLKPMMRPMYECVVQTTPPQ